MTKQQAVDYFRAWILPNLDITDRSLVRMTWNDYVDGLEKDGEITERQAATWTQPKFISR